MSGIKIYVKDEQEKKALVDAYLEEDNRYLEALEVLRQELIAKGIDITTGDGRKIYIRAVRSLNDSLRTPPCQK